VLSAAGRSGALFARSDNRRGQSPLVDSTAEPAGAYQSWEDHCPYAPENPQQHRMPKIHLVAAHIPGLPMDTDRGNSRKIAKHSTVIKSGDIVRLKSGGPIMGVVSVDRSSSSLGKSQCLVECVWISGAEFRTGKFTLDSLEFVPGLGSDTTGN